MTMNDFDRIIQLAEATTKAIARVEHRIDALETATPEPDGLVERVEELELALATATSAINICFTSDAKRLDAHDAALADLRKDLDRYSQQWHDCLDSHIYDDNAHRDPAPPASRDLSGTFLGNDWVPPRPTVRTPAPPSLVVDANTVGLAAQAYTESGGQKPDRDSLYAALAATTAHWNASQDAADANQADTPDVGGE